MRDKTPSIPFRHPFVRQFKILDTIALLGPLLTQLRPLSRRIVLFGSCAQGTDAADSDVDLFVLTSDRSQVMALISHNRLERPVLATLSDKQRVLVNVLQTMWSGAPHQWCQGHYLRNAADPLYDYDHALKTDLRRDVRRTIRRSLSQVAAQAQQGDFAPQLVTGLVVGERPLLAETQSTPAAGSPTVADTPASTLPSACAAETTSTPVEQPVEPVPAPCPPLLPAGAAPSTAPAAEKPSPTAAEAIRQVLDEAPLPTPDAPGPGSAEVARSLAFTLGRIADQPVTDPWLLTFRQHLLDLSVIGLACSTRLAQVPPEVYQAERARWQARQEQFRQRYRWRHNRAGVLAKLEQAWASGAPDSS